MQYGMLMELQCSLVGHEKILLQYEKFKHRIGSKKVSSLTRSVILGIFIFYGIFMFYSNVYVHVHPWIYIPEIDSY